MNYLDFVLRPNSILTGFISSGGGKLKRVPTEKWAGSNDKGPASAGKDNSGSQHFQ